MLLKIKKLHPDAIIPSYQHEGDSGLSLHAIDDYTLFKNNIILVDTGIAIELPPGYEAQVRPRSGMALKYGVTIVNSPGTIDNYYTGRIQIVMTLIGGDAFYYIDKGDNIAQLVVKKIEQAEIIEVEELDSTVRGSSSFGSTGR